MFASIFRDLLSLVFGSEEQSFPDGREKLRIIQIGSSCGAVTAT